MASSGMSAIRDAASSAILAFPAIKSLTESQYMCLESFLNGKDTVALLPTGSGKSLIYQIAPIVAGIMVSRENAPPLLAAVKRPILIVVSPLAALIRDQIEEAKAMGISAISLLDATEKDAEYIKQGRYQLVFGIPELWLESDWGDVLLSDHYEQNLIGIVVDEVHKTPSWGKAKKGVKAFRECFGRLAELRSLCRNGIPVLALTASADAKTRKDIVHLLRLKKDTTYVEESPNKSNIRLSCTPVKGADFSCFDWLVKGLKAESNRHPKVLIYCRSIPATSALYEYLKYALGDRAYVGPNKKSRDCLVAMYHSLTHVHKKEEALHCFEEGPVRVVVATTALSMGINFKDVRYVVHYGAPHCIEDMLQQIGRAGRDGDPAHGIVYSHGPKGEDDDVKMFVNRENCLRMTLYNVFEKDKTTVSQSPGHDCCSVCHKTCCCNKDLTSCDEPLPEFEVLKGLTEEKASATFQRSITDDQIQRLREGLIEYRLSLVQSKKLMYNFDMTTGFSMELIDCIVEHAPYIHNVEYIKQNILVYKKEHVEGIMAIVNKVFKDKLDMDDLLQFIENEFGGNEEECRRESFNFGADSFTDPPSSSSEESGDDD